MPGEIDPLESARHLGVIIQAASTQQAKSLQSWPGVVMRQVVPQVAGDEVVGLHGLAGLPPAERIQRQVDVPWPP